MWHVAAGAGVPVLFIHGAFADYRFFEPQLGALSRRRKVIVCSLEGYHPNPFHIARFSAQRHLEQLEAALRLVVGKVHVVGHSRGARIALHLAAACPEMLLSLTLVEPGGVMDDDFLGVNAVAGGLKWSSGDPRETALALLQTDREAAIRAYLEHGFGHGAWDRSDPLFKRVGMANIGTLAGMVPDRSVPLSRNVARQVKCPTLLVGGTDSPKIFEQIIEVLQATIADARRVTLAGADHFMTLGQAHAFNTLLEAYFDKVEGRASAPGSGPNR